MKAKENKQGTRWPSGFLILLLLPAMAGILNASPVLPKLRIRVSPGESGSDRLAIQAGLDSLKSAGGGTLVLSPGVYGMDNVQNAVVCDSCRNIMVMGSGPRTLLRPAPGTEAAHAYFLFRNSSSISFRNLRLEGLELPIGEWETNQRYHGGIRFMGSRDVSIDSCSFKGFYTGAVIFQAGTRDFQVRDCTFEKVAYRLKGDYGAISIETGSGRARVLRNRFTGLSHSAISAYVSDSLEIVGNRADFDLRSSFTMGVFAPQGLRNSFIARNRFSGMSNEGVVLNSGETAVLNNRIEHNVLNAKFAGVALNDGKFECKQAAAAGNIIYGNEITGVGTDSVRHAVLLNRASATIVRGNSVRRYHSALSIQYCSDGTLSSENDFK